MAVRMTVLASGSKGNSAVVSSSKTSILVDCGLSCRETLRRMLAAREDPGALQGVVITHEHSDHVAGLEALARKLKIPVYMTRPAFAGFRKLVKDKLRKQADVGKLEHFDSGRPFSIGDIFITPFTVPHDACDPVGFTFRAEGIKIGFATDLGYMPSNVKLHLRECDLLLLESNHDLEMLRAGPYPWPVKQRVMSRVGHLSNDAVADYFAKDYDGHAVHVVLGHLSENNNHPEIVRSTAEQALQLRSSLFGAQLHLAMQERFLAPICL